MTPPGPARAPLPTRSLLVAATIGCALLAAGAWAYVSAERFVYFWDYSGYWVKTVRLAALLPDPVGAAAEVVRSVRHHDYNLLAAVPLAPIAWMVGHERVPWVVSVVVVYGLPAIFALAAVALRLSAGPAASRGAGAAAAAVAVATIVLSPPLWGPVVLGSLDVGGVALGAGVWLLWAPGVAAASRARAIATGVLLVVLVLFRRWYAFWAVAWILALGVEALLAGRDRVERRRGLARVAAVAATSAVLLFALATPIALRMATSDPAAPRAAYRPEAPYRDGLALAAAHLGLLPLTLAGAGLAIALATPSTRSLARAMLVQSAAILALFLRAQALDRHHYYLVAPQVAAFAAVALLAAMDRLRSRALRRLVPATLSIALGIGFAAAFGPGAGIAIDDRLSILGGTRYRPARRDDFPELVRLCHTLDELTRSGGERIYVLTSDWVLSDDVLRNTHLSEPAAPDLSDRVFLSAHVDRREPFPSRLLQADYVVLAEPTRVHLRPEEQQVILVPAEVIRGGQGLGRAFRRLPDEFELAGGTTASIYRRVGPLADDDVALLRARLALGGKR